MTTQRAYLPSMIQQQLDLVQEPLFLDNNQLIIDNSNLDLRVI